MIALTYNTLLAATIVASLRFGGREERLAALVMAIATFLSVFATAAITERFAHINPALAVIDGAAFAALLAVALRSKSFWPLWIASLQLLDFAAVFAPANDHIRNQLAYAASEQVWAWPELLLIIVMSIWGQRLHRWATKGNRYAGSPDSS